MNDIINATIKSALCGGCTVPDRGWCDERQTEHCASVRQQIVDKVYTAHIKPLEDALAEAAADKSDMRDALKCIIEEIECADDECRCEEVAEIARAALAACKSTGEHK